MYADTRTNLRGYVCIRKFLLTDMSAPCKLADVYDPVVPVVVGENCELFDLLTSFQVDTLLFHHADISRGSRE